MTATVGTRRKGVMDVQVQAPPAFQRPLTDDVVSTFIVPQLTALMATAPASDARSWSVVVEIGKTNGDYWNAVTATGLTALFGALCVPPSTPDVAAAGPEVRVPILRLYKNTLGGDGADAVGRALGELQARGIGLPEEIHLSHCDITTAGAVSLFNAIADLCATDSAPWPVQRGKWPKPLWLRLEHNMIDHKALLDVASGRGLRVCMAESRPDDPVDRKSHAIEFNRAGDGVPPLSCDSGRCIDRATHVHLPYVELQALGVAELLSDIAGSATSDIEASPAAAAAAESKGEEADAEREPSETTDYCGLSVPSTVLPPPAPAGVADAAATRVDLTDDMSGAAGAGAPTESVPEGIPLPRLVLLVLDTSAVINMLKCDAAAEAGGSRGGSAPALTIARLLNAGDTSVKLVLLDTVRRELDGLKDDRGAGLYRVINPFLREGGLLSRLVRRGLALQLSASSLEHVVRQKGMDVSTAFHGLNDGMIVASARLLAAETANLPRRPLHDADDGNAVAAEDGFVATLLLTDDQHMHAVASREKVWTVRWRDVNTALGEQSSSPTALTASQIWSASVSLFPPGLPRTPAGMLSVVGRRSALQELAEASRLVEALVEAVGVSDSLIADARAAVERWRVLLAEHRARFDV